MTNTASTTTKAATDAVANATTAATNAAQEAAAGFSKSFDETTERINSFNEQLIEAAKRTGNLSLDTYEKAFASLVEFEEKVGNASQLDWVSALTQAHTSFLTEVSNSFTSAARDALK